MPATSVIVTNYNGGQLLQDCIRSVIETASSSFEVILVDNASTDGSAGIVAARFPSVKLIRLQRNVGFATASNVGLRAASGENLVLLNSDTVVDPNWLSCLLEEAASPHVAFVQPKIMFLDRPHLINSAGNEIHFAGFGVCRGIGSPDSNEYDDRRILGYASGACVLVTREALRKVGLLDEIFFAYGEDKDWGWRAKMLGLQSIYAPRARIYHKWSKVLGYSAEKMYYLEVERLVSVWKNHTKDIIIRLLPILLLVELAVLGYSIAKGWSQRKIQAYVRVFALRQYIVNRRKQLLVSRRVSEKSLLREFVFELRHPYLGRLSDPLNWLCKVYRTLVIPD